MLPRLPRYERPVVLFAIFSVIYLAGWMIVQAIAWLCAG